MSKDDLKKFFGYDRNAHKEFVFEYRGEESVADALSDAINAEEIGLSWSFLPTENGNVYFYGRRNPHEPIMGKSIVPEIVLHDEGEGRYVIVGTTDWAKQQIQSGLVDKVKGILTYSRKAK